MMGLARSPPTLASEDNDMISSPNSTVDVRVSDGVCTITLDRSDVLNALNDTLTDELAQALKDASRDKEVRVVVITGSGRAFSSGQDLADLKEKYVPDHEPHLGEDLQRRYNPIIKTIHSMEKPVIAAINGVAAGAGCSLALACDLRIASEDASFIEVFVNVGLVGLGRAMELCCTGRKVEADEALAIGMVNQVVPSEDLEEAVAKMAKRLASLPAKAISLTKRLLNQSFDHDLTEQLAQESYAQETAGRTHDHFEGVVAFIEKRKPNFTHE